MLSSQYVLLHYFNNIFPTIVLFGYIYFWNTKNDTCYKLKIGYNSWLSSIGCTAQILADSSTDMILMDWSNSKY